MQNNENRFNIDLTIVILVYNSEKYLPQCLDSIFNQSLENFEIIVVNDGSKGNCDEIIAEYQKTHNNIILIKNQYNEGQYQARRNVILFEARGKYIMHIDSDDYFKEDNKDFLKNAINMLNNTNADLLFFDCILTDGVKEWKSKWFSPPNKRLKNNKEIMEYFYNDGNHAMWGKIYRKSSVDLAYKELKDIEHISLFEDFYQNLIIAYFINSSITINEDFYCYRQLLDGDSKRLRKTKEEKESVIYQITSVLKSIDDFFISKSLYEKYGILFSCLLLNEACYRAFCLYNELYNCKDSYDLYIKNKIEWDDKLIPAKMKKNLEYSFLNNRDILIKKLTPYFFSIIIDKEYTVIKLFGIKIVLRNTKYVLEPKVISLSNMLRFLFSIDVEKTNKKTTVVLRLFGFRISLIK